MMIYFIKDSVTLAVKIGYSKDAKKRMAHLQTATPHRLELLGIIQGGLEHEAAYHKKFATCRLEGEWFKSDILPEVLAIVDKETANPQQPKVNVIVSGDSRFGWESANRLQNQVLVSQSLDEIHAKTPIAWVITGGEQDIHQLAWKWANDHQVEVYRYFPKWKTHGRFAGFKVGPQMLRSMFDPKLLLAFLSSTPSASMLKLIKGAEKKGIPVVTKTGV